MATSSRHSSHARQLAEPFQYPEAVCQKRHSKCLPVECSESGLLIAFNKRIIATNCN
jgi:hypothetical protein